MFQQPDGTDLCFRVLVEGVHLAELHHEEEKQGAAIGHGTSSRSWAERTGGRWAFWTAALDVQGYPIKAP